ncbi:TPA: hypothetical protein NJ623_004489 [Vibrio parahaemolyticus]|nr:hypothetical protein [Vibrio parahaemolyticus]
MEEGKRVNMNIKTVEGFKYVFVDANVMDNPMFAANFSEGDKPVNDWMIATNVNDEIQYLESKKGIYDLLVEQHKYVLEQVDMICPDLNGDELDLMEFYAGALLYWPDTL